MLVLYVDDEPALLVLGKIFLERSGKMQVDTALSAAQAIVNLRNRRYDGIIADYQMPGMDGIEFLKYVRAGWGRLPFILFTGKGREDVVIEALNSGADFYLQKGGDLKSRFAILESRIELAVEQRRTEDELLELHQWMSDIIDHLPDATFAIDLQGKVLAWNRAMEGMTNVKMENIVGTGDHSYAIPFYGERRPILLDLVLQENTDIERKYPFILRKDNKLVSEIFIPSLYGGKGAYLWSIASPLYDTKGNIIGAIESIRDVTERKQAENELIRRNEELRAAYKQLTATNGELRRNYDELSNEQRALRESEQRFRAVFDQIYLFIGLMTPDGTLIEANRTALQVSGVEESDAIGKLFWETPWWPHSPDLRETLRAAVTRASNGEFARFEATHQGGDGNLHSVDFLLKPVMDEEGSVVLLILEGRDITERKRVEEALCASEERYRILYLDNPAMFFTLDSDGKVVSVNLSGASQLGYAIDELEGQSVLKVFHEDDRQAVTEQLKICLQSPWQVHHWKFPEVRKDGSLLRVEEYVRAVIGPGGDLSVFITCQDITDRKRAEEELGIVRAELERQVEERAVELARADEQLKADITVRREGEEALRKARAEMERRIEERTTELVQSNNRLMAEIAERERAETALAMAGKRLNILSGITRHDVLNQLSVLQGILEFSQGFTHDPEGLLRFIAKEKKVAATIERLSTFTKDYQDTGVKAPEWQNVQNSIRSATGALPTGNIRVDAELENLEIFADPLLEMVFYNLIDNALGHGGEKITTIRFSSHESDRGMIIVCEDDGAGISGEAKKHLFERGLGENTGLGLYLVREILSITGITISETGEPGKGARFEIFVPEGTYRFMKIND